MKITVIIRNRNVVGDAEEAVAVMRWVSPPVFTSLLSTATLSTLLCDKTVTRPPPVRLCEVSALNRKS